VCILAFQPPVDTHALVALVDVAAWDTHALVALVDVTAWSAPAPDCSLSRSRSLGESGRCKIVTSKLFLGTHSVSSVTRRAPRTHYLSSRRRSHNAGMITAVMGWVSRTMSRSGGGLAPAAGRALWRSVNPQPIALPPFRRLVHTGDAVYTSADRDKAVKLAGPLGLVAGLFGSIVGTVSVSGTGLPFAAAQSSV
jgi:hypothetical protein